MSDRSIKLTSTVAAWLFGLLWALPLLYAIWAAIHPSAFATNFDLLAPLTLKNFERAWTAAPFARYFLNTVLLVLGIMAAPMMIKAGYDARLSSGAIAAGGTLGILIPPSVMLVVMGPVMGVPVKAAASSSSFMVGLTASASALIYYTHGSVNPRVTIAAVFGIVVGAQLGVRISSRVQPARLTQVFVVVLIVLGVSMALQAAGVL